MIGGVLRRGSMRSALMFAFLTGCVLSALPLFGVPGPESALVLGFLLPPWLALVAARWVIDARRKGRAASAPELINSVLLSTLLLLLAAGLVLELNSLRGPRCTPLQGWAFLALGPGLGMVLAGLLGATCAALIPSSKIATALAVAAPVVWVGAGVARFFGTPAIFVMNHIAGYFPGTIYDRDVAITVEYGTFRALTVVWIAALALLLAATFRRAQARSALFPVRFGRLALAVLLGVVGVAGFLHGPQLGHRATAAFISEQLGATYRGRRCMVHVPRELSPSEGQRLARDCDFRVHEAELAIGVREPRRVHAFFYRDQDEKKKLMGAGQTFIAKPWRHEVHLQMRAWPHPVLAHEIAHVVARNTARGPLGVSGRFGGWLPNPGLIEGLAVAAAWNQREGLTPHQWARTLLDLGNMPDISRVMGLSFLAAAPAHAYTAAGSFVRFVQERYGRAAVRSAYADGTFATALSKPLPQVEREWRAYLRGLTIPPQARALARQRFSQQSIFHAPCPHRVADLQKQLSLQLAAGEPEAIADVCQKILRIDVADVGTRAVLVGAAARLGELSRAQRELRDLSEHWQAPGPVQTFARQYYADALWARGDRETARATYHALLSQPQTDDVRRSLEVRRIAAEAGGREADLAFRLLIGERANGADPALAMHLARELGELRGDGLGPYLAARQLYNEGQFDLALPLLRQALKRQLPTSSLRKEAMRMVGRALYATDQYTAAAKHWRSVREIESMNLFFESQQWLRRIAWRTQGRIKAPSRTP